MNRSNGSVPDFPQRDFRPTTRSKEEVRPIVRIARNPAGAHWSTSQIATRASVATFRDAGFTPPIQSRPPPGSVGKRCTTREDLLLRTGGRVLHHLKPKCRPLPATAMLGLAQYAIQHALAFSQSRLTRTGMIPSFCGFFDVQPPEIAHYAGFPGIDPARDSNALFRASISIPRVFAPSWMSSSGTRSDWARAWRCHGCAHGPPELPCWHTGRKNGG